MTHRSIPEWREKVEEALAHLYGPTLRQVLAAKGIPSASSPLRGAAAIKHKRARTPLKLVRR